MIDEDDCGATGGMKIDDDVGFRRELKLLYNNFSNYDVIFCITDHATSKMFFDKV
jgi:hypothetical protein